jgi:hypothetical protein
MLPDTGIGDVKKQRNAEYAKHINDPVLSSLKMEGIRLLSFLWGIFRMTLRSWEPYRNSDVRTRSAASRSVDLGTRYVTVCVVSHVAGRSGGKRDNDNKRYAMRRMVL